MILNIKFSTCLELDCDASNLSIVVTIVWSNLISTTKKPDVKVSFSSIENFSLSFKIFLRNKENWKIQIVLTNFGFCRLVGRIKCICHHELFLYTNSIQGITAYVLLNQFHNILWRLPTSIYSVIMLILGFKIRHILYCYFLEETVSTMVFILTWIRPILVSWIIVELLLLSLPAAYKYYELQCDLNRVWQIQESRNFHIHI